VQVVDELERPKRILTEKVTVSTLPPKVSFFVVCGSTSVNMSTLLSSPDSHGILYQVFLSSGRLKGIANLIKPVVVSDDRMLPEANGWWLRSEPFSCALRAMVFPLGRVQEELWEE
jgi:hypothetical protein